MIWRSCSSLFCWQFVSNRGENLKGFHTAKRLGQRPVEPIARRVEIAHVIELAQRLGQRAGEPIIGEFKRLQFDHFTHAIGYGTGEIILKEPQVLTRSKWQIDAGIDPLMLPRGRRRFCTRVQLVPSQSGRTPRIPSISTFSSERRADQLSGRGPRISLLNDQSCSSFVR